jgi:signal transduction histidine kinase
MKRLAVYIALVFPALLLGLWAVAPGADPTFAAPLFHFYIVTFTTFAATVVSLFVFISAGETALPRHLLLALAFAWMGGIFLLHGALTPGALIDHFTPVLSVSAWLTLFGGGVLFLVGAFAPNHPDPRFLRVTAVGVAAAYVVYYALALLTPQLIVALVDLTQTPRVQDIFFVVTGAIWLVSGVRHYLIHQRTRNFVDALMAFEAGWFAIATVSMFRFQLWRASWWTYHVLLLAGFLIAIYALWRAYEQIRTFRLTRYYAATSLIVTAALALFAADLYTNLVFDNLRAQIERDTANLSQQLANQVASDLPAVATAEQLRAARDAPDLASLLDQALHGTSAIQALSLYDLSGLPLYSSLRVGDTPNQLAPPPNDMATFQDTLSGTATFMLMAPGTSVPGYAPTASVHVLETYVPFWPNGEAQAGAPIGVLATLREAPELTRAAVLSRGAGLLLAGLSLGALFSVLLIIVRRADRLITSRTRELERAYSDLRQAEGLRDDLTRMIIHDLRNPLTAITANLDLIGKTLQNPAYQDAPPRFLTSARAAGQRMTGMIDDLLNVSKFEAGELRPVTAPVYLPTLLNDKVEAFRPLAEKEGKTLRVNAPTELPVVMADAGLIGRVVENLLSNAFKYTEAGGTIEVSVQPGGPVVNVRVRDDGQGIPPEYHARIFEKFVQVTSPNGQPLRKGTGLGLAFCRMAVCAHGGQIRVESAPGQGSMFSFSLPLSGP